MDNSKLRESLGLESNLAPPPAQPVQNQQVTVYDSTDFEDIDEDGNVPVLKTTDTKEDYDFARNNLKKLVNAGQDAIKDALDLARSIDKPSGFDAVANLIKAVTDATDKVLQVQKTVKEMEHGKRSDGVAPVHVDKAVFVGSASDMLTRMKTIN